MATTLITEEFRLLGVLPSDVSPDLQRDPPSALTTLQTPEENIQSTAVQTELAIAMPDILRAKAIGRHIKTDHEYVKALTHTGKTSPGLNPFPLEYPTFLMTPTTKWKGKIVHPIPIIRIALNHLHYYEHPIAGPAAHRVPPPPLHQNMCAPAKVPDTFLAQPATAPAQEDPEPLRRHTDTLQNNPWTHPRNRSPAAASRVLTREWLEEQRKIAGDLPYHIQYTYYPKHMETGGHCRAYRWMAAQFGHQPILPSGHDNIHHQVWPGMDP